MNHQAIKDQGRARGGGAHLPLRAGAGRGGRARGCVFTLRGLESRRFRAWCAHIRGAVWFGEEVGCKTASARVGALSNW